MTEQSDIPAPSPEDDVIEHQERVEFVIDKEIEDKADDVRPFDDNDVAQQYFELDLGASVVAVHRRHEKLRADHFDPVAVALTAGAVVKVVQKKFDSDSVVTHDDLSFLKVTFVKVADANGIPVAQVATDLNGSRASNVVTLPADVSGFANTHTTSAADGFVVTVANAAWYVVSASYSA